MGTILRQFGGQAASHQLWQKVIRARGILYFFGIIVVFLAHSLRLNVVAEDAYITFQFARHLANGQGIVWNAGEAPVEGYTNFLWLLLSALLLKTGLNVLLFTQLLGVLASLVTMIYVYRFGRKIFVLPYSYALVPCLFLAVSGPFAAWASSGMETNLFGMFVLIGCYYCSGWVKFDSSKDLALCFLMLFFATLTRPEGFMIFALIAVLAAAYSAGRVAWMPYFLAVSIYVIPFLIYFFWRYSYFGFLLPNTFYAKTGSSLAQYIRGLKYSGLFAFHFLLPLAPIFFTFFWENGFGRASRLLRDQSIAQHLKTYISIYLSVLIVGVYSLYIVYVGGDYMAMYRFFVPVLPFIYLLTGPAIHQLFQATAGLRHKRVLISGLMAFAIGMTTLQSTPFERQLFHKPEFMHGTYQGIQIERWHVARYRVIADFFREYKRSAEDSLAVGPIGILAYYSDMPIYSIFGIVDPYIAHKEMDGMGQGLPGHEKFDIPYVLAKRPTYFMFSLDLRSAPESYPSFSDEANKIIQENYRLKSVWLDDPINGEAGYFTFLELKTSNP